MVNVPTVTPSVVEGKNESAVLTCPLDVTRAFADSAVPLHLKLPGSIKLNPG